MTFGGHDALSPNRVALSFCYSAYSIYTPEPCSIELLELERGEVITEGTGDEPLQIERGSRVRLRVECPEEGLYSPGADLPTRQQFSPYEFELEASDCEVR